MCSQFTALSSYSTAFIYDSEMAALRKVDVLKQLVEIFEFQRVNKSDNVSTTREMLLLRQQCQNFIADEKMRLEKCDTKETISVRTCELSKLQFPQSQLERSALNIPVR